MNRSLALLVTAALGLSALAAACSSETVGSSTGATEPGAASSSSGTVGDPADEDRSEDGDGQPGVDPEDDAGGKADAGKKDSGPSQDPGPGPLPFTKAEIQALVGARCAPCHVGGAAGGLSLANDFTTATVGIASTQVPGMKRIAAGDKDASYLFHKLRGTHQTGGGSGDRMPKGGPAFLADSDVERIGAFIDAL